MLTGGGPGYAKWLYAPGAVAERDHYGFTYVRTDEFADHKDDLGDWYTMMKSSTNETLKPAGLDFGGVEASLSISPATVYTGSFDSKEVTDDLERNGFRADGERDGTAVYVSAEDHRTFGVGDEAITVISDGEYGVDALATVIDAKNGDADRYVDVNKDMKAVTNSLGDRTYVDAQTHSKTEKTDVDSGQFGGAVAGGGGFDIGSDVTKLKVVIVFASAEDASTDEVKEWVATDSFENVEDTSVSKSGRLVTITGSSPTSKFFG